MYSVDKYGKSGIRVYFKSLDKIDAYQVRDRATSVISEVIKQRAPEGENNYRLTPESTINAPAVTFYFKYKETKGKGKNKVKAGNPNGGVRTWVLENVVKKMQGDFIDGNPPKISSDGGLITRNRIPLRVDFFIANTDDDDPDNDKPEASGGGLESPVDSRTNYDNSGQGGDGNGGNDGTGSSWTTWALIGGGVLLLLIVVAMFLKKKK